VSLTHEQAFFEYDPAKVPPERLLKTMRDIGYTLGTREKCTPTAAVSVTTPCSALRSIA
jgi:hypothetical protein